MNSFACMRGKITHSSIIPRSGILSPVLISHLSSCSTIQVPKLQMKMNAWIRIHPKGLPNTKLVTKTDLSHAINLPSVLCICGLFFPPNRQSNTALQVLITHLTHWFGPSLQDNNSDCTTGRSRQSRLRSWPQKLRSWPTVTIALIWSNVLRSQPHNCPHNLHRLSSTPVEEKKILTTTLVENLHYTVKPQTGNAWKYLLYTP